MERVVEAAGIFNKMIVGGNCQPNVVTYGTIIRGFCMKGNNSAAIQLLRKMEEGPCKPNLVVYNTIIYSLCKDTLGLVANTITYNTLADGFLQSG
ncbi:unnamed protein product [Prunus brigantina]